MTLGLPSTTKRSKCDPLSVEVKRALILMHEDYPVFFDDLRSNEKLQVGIQELMESEEPVWLVAHSEEKHN